MRAREYTESLSRSISQLLSDRECAKSPYARQNSTGKTKIFVIAGDRGLAGGYNANIFRAMREYPDVDVIPIGKRACDRYHGQTCRAEGFDYEAALGLSIDLCRDFREGKYSRIAILGTRYISMMSQQVELKQVLPLVPDENATAVGGMVYEPDELTVLDAAVPEYVAGLLVSAARESFACEIAARRTAMDSAGKNAQEMIDRLQLEYNRARQSAITQEITEIVAGSGQ